MSPSSSPGAPALVLRQYQQGASLIVVMMVLTVVSLLGVAGIQISTMAERGARNDRDLQLAWQGAEAGLADAELEMHSQSNSATRAAIFRSSQDMTSFLPNCGTSGDSLGLCELTFTGKPVWLTVDFTATKDNRSVEFGQFTDKKFAAGGAGVQPARAPRYVIEPIRDPNDRDLRKVAPKFIYRVTSMGFGPREDIQAVVQMLYRE